MAKALRRMPSLRGPRGKTLQAYSFILPGLILLLLVLGVPTGMAVANSFVPLWSEGGSFSLENYVRLVDDELFWNSLRVTLLFVGSTVGLHLVVGLVVAVALNSQIRAGRLLAVIVILPWTVPDVMAGLMWRFMYNPTAGVINHVLQQLGLTTEYIEWLAHPNLALFSVILADVWRGYPFVMLILLAGLQAIPRELYEAAWVDGANALRTFRHISLPLLGRMFIIAAALDTIWQFRRFGLIFNMTAGGPGHVTEILSLYIYKHYFRYFNFEYASAIAVVLAIIMLAISFPYVRMIVRRL